MDPSLHPTLSSLIQASSVYVITDLQHLRSRTEPSAPQRKRCDNVGPASDAGSRPRRRG